MVFIDVGEFVDMQALKNVLSNAGAVPTQVTSSAYAEEVTLDYISSYVTGIGFTAIPRIRTVCGAAELYRMGLLNMKHPGLFNAMTSDDVIKLFNTRAIDSVMLKLGLVGHELSVSKYGTVPSGVLIAKNKKVNYEQI